MWDLSFCKFTQPRYHFSNSPLFSNGRVYLHDIPISAEQRDPLPLFDLEV
jgi:hypothetical protein